MTVESFNQQFEEIINPLKSFILKITASLMDTEDIVQDTYIKALDRLNTFRGESSLKTWLFTIASNLAKDNLRAQNRWTEDVSDICKSRALSDPDYFPGMSHVQTTSPQGQFEVKEHISFCFSCISKSLPLEQQLCIYLKEVFDFKVAEIAGILNSTEPMVKYYLHTGRSKMISVFDGRCALINKKGTCHQCSELNGLFNPKQNAQQEIMKIEMAKEAADGDKEHLFDLRLKLIKSIDPFKSAGADLQLFHLEYNRKIMENN